MLSAPAARGQWGRVLLESGLHKARLSWCVAKEVADWTPLGALGGLGLEVWEVWGSLQCRGRGHSLGGDDSVSLEG